jgi:hypothetical protein
MEQVPPDTKQRTPSSRVLEDLLDQAPADYFTLAWLMSTLHQRSFGIVILFLGLLATAPIGSTVPGLVLAVVAVQMIAGRRELVFPRFITARSLPTRYLFRLVGALFLYCDILRRQFIRVGRLPLRPSALLVSWSCC